MPTSASPTVRVAMSDKSSAPLPPPPVVTLSVDPVPVSPETCPSTHPKTKRTLLSTLKNSPSMLRRRIKPTVHVNNSSRDSWDAGSVSTGTSGGHHNTGTESAFTGKEFHVRYQGRTRVTTLQVSEAVNAVKKLAPDLSASSSSSSSPASSSTEDLLAASSGHRSSSPSLSSSPSPSNLSTSSPQLRPSSPTNLTTPKSPRNHPKTPSKSFFKSCCLSITKRCVVIDDDEKLINETIPIATVAYCATDLRYPRAVALICKTYSSVLICHVFVCSSKEKAEKIVAFIGKAFESAWHDWKCINDPSSLGANNNNYEQLFRARAVSCDITKNNRGACNDKLHNRHSSYETRNDAGFDFSSPEDEY